MPLSPVPGTTANIEAAAAHLRAGHLVAFPTETVYGLGADATNAIAVAKIFQAKGRPAFNPLIIHVTGINAARHFARLTPPAEKLAAAFWPGGLTLVLEQEPRPPGSSLSDLVSAGLPSVAVRVPSHPLAQRLLAAAGCPVAAPSANRSGHVSATSARHVADDLGDDPNLAMILDDGPCAIGLESTIVDARGHTMRLLRPGAITIEDITRRTGIAVEIPDVPATAASEAAPRPEAPGMLESHYAPAKPLRMNVMVPRTDEAWLTFGSATAHHRGLSINLSPSGDLVEASANLFAALRDLDQTGAAAIAAMPVPDEGLGRAINDRLRRAAAPRHRGTAGRKA